MNADFHYYATYCAALIAGYSVEEAKRIAYSDNFVDVCTKTMLKNCGAPLSAATTQTTFELADITTDILGLQEITRIWSSFHFLPGDLYAPIKYGSRNYRNKYRLICKPNSALVKETVEIAKDQSLEAIGIAMHILCDTWAHQNFAGTPSLVINNTTNYLFEVIGNEKFPLNMTRNVAKGDSIEQRRYTNSLYQGNETSIMNLGHGRAGHLPDLSFITYEYMPAWGKYHVIIKNNPQDFMLAFKQMVYALKYLRGDLPEFKLNTYDPLAGYEQKIDEIIRTRKLKLDEEWSNFAKDLGKEDVPPFDAKLFVDEYINAPKEKKDETNFGLFLHHALKQKSMVTNRIWQSHNNLAGYSITYNGNSLKGLKDYWTLIGEEIKGAKK